MIEGDLSRFASILTGVSDYYGKTLSDGVLRLYWEGLKQYDMQAVEQSLWKHTQNPDNGQFMPKISDVTRMIQGTTSDSALNAWAKVDKAIRLVGTYRDVIFDDALIHRVIYDMGGWVGLGQKQESDWPFVAKEFENRYRGYKSRNEIPDYQPIIKGLANMHNERGGFQMQEPVFIGKPEVAQRVMLGGTNQILIQMQSVSDALPALNQLKRIA